MISSLCKSGKGNLSPFDAAQGRQGRRDAEKIKVNLNAFVEGKE